MHVCNIIHEIVNTINSPKFKDADRKKDMVRLTLTRNARCEKTCIKGIFDIMTQIRLLDSEWGTDVKTMAIKCCKNNI